MELSDLQHNIQVDSLTWRLDLRSDNLILHFALALNEEAGEVAGVIKKWDRKDFGKEKMALKVEEEMGDVLIYLMRLANELGIDLEDAYYKKRAINERRARVGNSDSANRIA